MLPKVLLNGYFKGILIHGRRITISMSYPWSTLMGSIMEIIALIFRGTILIEFGGSQGKIIIVKYIH